MNKLIFPSIVALSLFVGVTGAIACDDGGVVGHSRHHSRQYSHRSSHALKATAKPEDRKAMFEKRQAKEKADFTKNEELVTFVAKQKADLKDFLAKQHEDKAAFLKDRADAVKKDDEKNNDDSVNNEKKNDDSVKTDENTNKNGWRWGAKSKSSDSVNTDSKERTDFVAKQKVDLAKFDKDHVGDSNVKELRADFVAKQVADLAKFDADQKDKADKNAVKK